MQAIIGEEAGIDGVALGMGSAIAGISPDARAVGAMAGKAEFGGGFKDKAFVTARGFADDEKVRDLRSGLGSGLLFQITPHRAFRVRDG